MALDLLKNADLRGAIVAESEQRALEHLSFRAVRSQLAKFFAQFGRNKPRITSIRVNCLKGRLSDALVHATRRAIWP